MTAVGFFAWLFFAGGWTPAERRRLYAIGVLFLAAAMFWSLFEQAGSTLNLFADRATRNVDPRLEFPSSWFQSVQLAVHHHLRAGVRVAVAAARARSEPSSPTKFALA